MSTDGKLDPFTLEMMRSIVREHETVKNNDHGTGFCCQLAVSYTRKIAAHEGVVAQHRADQAAGKPVFNPLSERQANYIRSLARRTQMSLLAPNVRMLVETVQAQNEISREDAKIVLDALLALKDEAIPSNDEARSTRVASSAQIGFLKRLLATREHDIVLDLANLADLPMSRASELITELKELPFKGESAMVKAPAVEVSEGVYLVDKTVYKVKVAVHGSGSLYASKWDPEDEKWDYCGQRVFPMLTQDARMTPEQAKAWGDLYGRCVRCDLPLTNEISQAHGYGRKCAQNEGWPYDMKILQTPGKKSRKK